MSIESGTREAILVAARQRLAAVGPARVRMIDVARAAGVSRQTVYLHFGSRGGLLVALVEFIDRVEGLEELLQWVFAAPDAETLLDRVVDLQAIYNPRIVSVAAGLETAAVGDPDAAAAWRNRKDSRLDGSREVIRRLSRDGALTPELTEIAAVDLLWSLASLSSWRNLVVDRGWSDEQYSQHLKRLLRRVLLA